MSIGWSVLNKPQSEEGGVSGCDYLLQAEPRDRRSRLDEVYAAGMASASRRDAAGRRGGYTSLNLNQSYKGTRPDSGKSYGEWSSTRDQREVLLSATCVVAQRFCWVMCHS